VFGCGNYRYLAQRVLTLRGRGVFPGRAEGVALVGPASVPGWDTFDPATGQVLEIGNPLFGQSVKGRILVLSGSRGSTGWGTQFLKIRLSGVGPAALLFPRVDSRIAAAIVVSKVPAVADFDEDLMKLVKTGDKVSVDGTLGIVEIL
jgi:phosphomecalonate degydratase small subunit